MRFAALERNGAAGFARVSIALPCCVDYNALLWARGGQGTLDHRIPCVHEAQKHLGRIVVGWW